jgi:2-C-methyl-D-erythritol 4-phosphate cytidylyltransferase/2-C-methyl-D-erythritol 2,4-cyclodiphosphate synthase
MASGEIGAVAVLLAAGAGRRVGGDLPKAFLAIGERPMLAVAAAAASASSAIRALVVAAPEGFEGAASGCLEGLPLACTVVTGGATRQESVLAAIGALADDVEVVVIHDAARPFAPPDLFTAVVDAVVGGADGAIPILPVTDTVKKIQGDAIVATIDRDELGLAQTPQAYRVDALRDAHTRAVLDGTVVTDDAMLLERDGRVVAVAGDPMNVKVTTMFDLARADARMGGTVG